MALETLNGVEEIGGFKTIDLGQTKKDDRFKDENGAFNWDDYDAYRKDRPISIYHEENMISFKIQDGPIKENGVNGCQVDTVIEAAKIILEGLNKNFPCRENAVAITKLDEALMWLEKRKKDREKRNVEGFNKE